MSEETNAIIIDNGTGMMKGGIAGEDAPKSCFPTLLGRPNLGKIIGSEDKEAFLGFEAFEKRQILELNKPIQGGNIKDWDDMIKVWNYLYYSELKVDPTEQPVHLADNTHAPAGSREKMMEIMFEDFRVPAFYISNQAVLSLYASGKTIGLVVDSGEGVTSIMPVYEAYGLNHAAVQMPVAGSHLTEYMAQLLSESGVQILDDRVAMDTAKDIKEKHSFMALDFDDEQAAYDQGEGRYVDYTLPDGKVVRLANLLMKCPEVMFNPSLIKKDIGGIDQQCYASIQKADPDIRKDLYANILLAGGNSLIHAFGDRLSKDISNSAPSTAKVKVTAPDERKYSAWIGGSLLSTLATFQTMWIQRNEFEEVGSQIVFRKCM